jgi:hypothetical protein
MICTQIDWDMVFAFSKKDQTVKTEWIEKEQLIVSFQTNL